MARQPKEGTQVVRTTFDPIVILAAELRTLWATAIQEQNTPEKTTAWRQIDAIEHFVLSTEATTLEGAAAQLVIAQATLNQINPRDMDGDEERAAAMDADLNLAMNAIRSALYVIQKATGVDVLPFGGEQYFTLEELARLGCEQPDPEPVAAAA